MSLVPRPATRSLALRARLKESVLAGRASVVSRVRGHGAGRPRQASMDWRLVVAGSRRHGQTSEAVSGSPPDGGAGRGGGSTSAARRTSPPCRRTAPSNRCGRSVSSPPTLTRWRRGSGNAALRRWSSNRRASSGCGVRPSGELAEAARRQPLHSILPSPLRH